MLVKLRFAIDSGQPHIIASFSGSVVDFVYGCNDLYDPYKSAGGAQARGFDQYMSLYRYFCVIGSRAVIRFFYVSEDGSGYPMRVAIVSRDSGTAITQAADIAESPRATSRVISSGESVVTLARKFSVKKTFGVRNMLDNPTHFGSIGASPTEQWYYHVCGYVFDSTTQSVSFTGYIDYIAVLLHFILPSQS